jgi:elongation factor G
MSTITYVISVPLQLPADAMAALTLRAALDEMCTADPTLSVAIEPGNEIVLQGFSELQMEFAIDTLKRGKGLVLQVGSPQVRYLETITKIIEWEYTHKRRTAGGGEYAKVKIRFEPGEPDSGFEFKNAMRGAAVPEAFIPAVENGLRAAKETGVIAGLPVIDLKCTLIDGGYHAVDSTERTFDIAARACFREALPKAEPRLLEPMMEVGVVTPQKYLGNVIGDLNSRHGQVTGMDGLNGMQVIIAFVPVANLFGYIYTLKHMTRGGATCTMAFSHYEQVPPAIGPDDDNFPPAVGMRA